MSRTPVDHYTLLGVATDASADEIKKAYRALAKQYHPDVTGSDPEKLEHFKRVKAAYETLSDPSSRARYDRSRQPRPAPGHRRMPGGFYFWEEPPNPNEPQEPRGPQRKDRSNDIDLEDIFGDHGGFVDFGFGSGPKGPQGRPRPQPGMGGGGGASAPGTDVSLKVDVPADVARDGGTVTVTYKRQRRTEDGRGLFEYDELYDLKVPPNTTHGDTLRSEGWGNAGSGGGPYGDLVCDIRVVGTPSSKPPPRSAPRAAPEAAEPALRVVPISIQEALLGGRLEIKTPQGVVLLNLPPCTSGGAKFRLRGKGEPGADGRPTDLMIQLRVVTPPLLDDESVKLIERFAELNPYNPRENS